MRNVLCYGLTLMALAACGRDAELPPPHAPAGGKTGTSTNNSSAGANGGPDGTNADGTPSGTGTTAPDILRSTRSTLQWKRSDQFEADLSQALSLDKGELCNEFGVEACIQSVHLSPLGGHNPFTTGLLESSAEPLVTTSTVVERIVLSACIARREKDRALGADQAVVFTGLALDAPAPSPDDAGTRAIISGLYKRFLARDAEQVELDTLAALTRDDAGAAVQGDAFAAAVCMAIGSSSEFLFF